MPLPDKATIRSIICFTLALAGYLPTLCNAQAGAWDYGFSADGYAIVDVGERRDVVYGIMVQPDGKAVIVGQAEGELVNDFTMLMARFNADGSLDQTFNGDGIGLFPQLRVAFDVAIQPEGKMLVLAEGVSGPVLMRLTQFGFPDSDFDLDGQVEYSVPGYLGGWGGHLALYPDGRIMVGGEAYNIGQNYFFAARFLPDGALDNSFSLDGFASVIAGHNLYSGYSDMALMPDGGVVMIGTHGIGEPDYTQHLRMVRFTPTGELDYNFGINGIVDDAMGMPEDDGDFYPMSVTALLDGGILVTGMRGYPYSDGVVAKYLANGSRDPSFSFDGLVVTAPRINDAVVQPDGKILASTEHGFLRLLPNGTLDPSFGTNGVVSVGSTAFWYLPLMHIALAPDGKIHTAGYGIILDNDDHWSILVARFLNDINIGIAEFSAAGNALVYPNPVHEEATFTFTLERAETLTCEVMDGQGKVVRTLFDGRSSPPGEYSETVDLSGLAAGQYLLVLRNGTGATTVKLTKKNP